MSRIYPEDTLETPFGPITIATTGPDHIILDANSNGEHITINRVDVTLFWHLYRQPDGTWSPLYIDSGGRRQTSHTDVRKVDWTNYNQSFASATAHRKARETLIPLAAKWAEEHPDLLRAGQRANNAFDRARITRQIQDKERELTELRAQLAAIVDPE